MILRGYSEPYNYVFFNEVYHGSPVALRSGIASTHLVKYSMATKIKMFSFEGELKGPTSPAPNCEMATRYHTCRLWGWCGSNLLALDSHGIFSQILPRPSSFLANNIPFTRCIYIASSFLGVLCTHQSVLPLTSP